MVKTKAPLPLLYSPRRRWSVLLLVALFCVLVFFALLHNRALFHSHPTLLNVTRPQSTPPRPVTELARQACLNPPTTRSQMVPWFSDLLKQHDIPFFIAYGTLLGAVRNERVIPWTCDIDFVIPSLQQSRKTEQFFSDLVCDDEGDDPYRCMHYCVLGRTNEPVFHMRFNAETMERCQKRKHDSNTENNIRSNVHTVPTSPGTPRTPQTPGAKYGLGEPVYLDVYGVLSQETANTKKGWPSRTAEEQRVNPSLYMVGSKDNAKKHGHFLTTNDIYPLNMTGAIIDGSKNLCFFFSFCWRLLPRTLVHLDLSQAYSHSRLNSIQCNNVPLQTHSFVRVASLFCFPEPYPTPRFPELYLTEMYTANWWKLDHTWNNAWCLFGWCWGHV